MELFEQARRQEIERGAPLAARMRPRTLDEYAGQQHVIGPGRLLRRAIQADQLTSLIFYGPPGTGKTTLAMVIANTTRSHFVTLNAVLAGVGELREVTRRAQEDLSLYGQRTTLFVDEVHRWNRAQQDALLPWVEKGTIIMIGATTENPWFSVNRPLLSRSRVFQLKPLETADLVTIAQQALADPERGYGALTVDLRPEALDHLVNVANGDARSLLNALELAVETTPPDAQGVILVTRSVAEESIQQRAVLYDREGDYHFDTISAFIKSLRGSDPDAALYWLAKMVYAGEDPRFMFRRMLILASEDVGLADPQALTVVESAAAAFERIGLPEGQFHLTQAALYLATAPKSNSALAFFDAMAVVKAEKDAEVPSHLRDASRDKESFGHGEGYLYPHAYRDHWVAQQYLPDALQGQLFYQPSDQGYERGIKDQVARRREEQLAAVIEGPTYQQEVLTFSPSNRREERWLARTVSDAGRSLGELRDRIFQRAVLLRHHLVLDLTAGSGLLTWEAVRRVPEGGVWSLAWDQAAYDLMTQQAAALPELRRPVVVSGTLGTLPASLAAAGHPEQRFDVLIGRNALTRSADRAAVFRALADCAQPGAQLSLAEVVPQRGQRLYDLVPSGDVTPELLAAWQAAEEAIYQAPDDLMTNWLPEDLRAGSVAGGWQDVELLVDETSAEHLFTRSQLDRWFSSAAAGDRPTYAMHLARQLAPAQIAEIEGLLRRHLQDQSVPWHSTIAYLIAHRPSARHLAE